MFEYTLTLNSSQTREVLKAVELLMRLKLGQYREIPFALVDINDDDFCKKRDNSEPLLKTAFDVLYKNKEKWKDEEWYRLYNLYQVIRKNLHDAENPNGKGIDGDPPLQFTDEPLPKMEWKKNERII